MFESDRDVQQSQGLKSFATVILAELAVCQWGHVIVAHPVT